MPVIAGTGHRVGRLAGFPGLRAQVFAAQVDRAGIFDHTKNKSAILQSPFIFHTPGVFTNFLGTIGIVEQIQMVIRNCVGSDAAPTGHIIIDAHNAFVELQLPNSTTGTVICATSASPPLWIGRVKFGVGAIDGSPFLCREGGSERQWHIKQQAAP